MQKLKSSHVNCLPVQIGAGGLTNTKQECHPSHDKDKYIRQTVGPWLPFEPASAVRLLAV
jgi:hypothetical protein